MTPQPLAEASLFVLWDSHDYLPTNPPVSCVSRHHLPVSALASLSCSGCCLPLSTAQEATWRRSLPPMPSMKMPGP